MKLKDVIIIILLLFAVSGTIMHVTGVNIATNITQENLEIVNEQPTPSPNKITPFKRYTPPTIEKKREYTIVMIGDSMTHALGPHGGPFYEKINVLYKNSGHGILVDNYANPSTNILSLDKAMNTKTTFNEWTFEPLLSRHFDLILVESFGYNPLSQYGIENGIKKQTEELDKLTTTITNSHPNSAIVFVATIAPNRINYGRFVNAKDPPSARAAQVDERIAYIKNHIDYANAHNIPVINIFEKSLTPQGDGNLKYINPHDYIHPSAEGIEFISQELSNYIFANKLFPL
jgi:lysophospholipase L1-like esterase